MGKQNQQDVVNGRINIIGPGTLVEGNLSTKGDLRVDGTIKGEVDVFHRLAIGPSGKVEGNICCETADISGKVTGNLEVRGTLFLKRTARIKGDIMIGKLIVESGAEFLGACTMIDDERKDRL